MNLTLSVRAGLDRSGSADQVADTGKRLGTQSLANINRGQPAEGDPLWIGDHEVGVPVPIGIDPLDVDDPALGRAAAGQALWAIGWGNGFGGRFLLPRGRS